MNIKRLTTMLLGAALVFGMVGQAQAVSTPYVVNGILSGGGLLTGTMDVDSNVGFLGNIVDWSFMTSGGVDPNGNVVPDFTYNPTTANLTVNSAIFTLATTSFSTGRSLTFTGYNPRLNQPGPYTIGLIAESYKYATSFECCGGRTITFNKTTIRKGSGHAAPVPEPASLLLLSSGIAALGAWRYRKGKNS